jgi:phosphoglycolate phosphatase
VASKDKPKIGLLVVDLDNTLWDWVGVWSRSFDAMLKELLQDPGLEEAQLKKEIRQVHQNRGTTEYSFLLDEIPSLKPYLKGTTTQARFAGALHAQNSARFHSMALYPGVLSTLMRIRQSGVVIVAYTESVAFWAEWRIRRTGLDGVLDYLYSAPDHDFPAGVTPRKVRSKPAGEYGLKKTVHLHVPKGMSKPNPAILAQIVNEHAIEGLQSVYVGDSLRRDVAMAQSVGAIDVHARYGVPSDQDGYLLLTDLTAWTDEQVAEEARSDSTELPTPAYVLESSFSELLDHFDFGVAHESAPLLDAWKQTVNVQQHFNDICWRIRALALTALTFILSATGYVYVNVSNDAAFDPGKSASLVCFIGVFLWFGFWFMDAAWYHRLLKGAVTEGERLERLLRGQGVSVELGSRITDSSHDTIPGSALPRHRWLRALVPRRASRRLHSFYGAVTCIILVVGVVLVVLA